MSDSAALILTPDNQTYTSSRTISTPTDDIPGQYGTPMRPPFSYNMRNAIEIIENNSSREEIVHEQTSRRLFQEEELLTDDDILLESLYFSSTYPEKARKTKKQIFIDECKFNSNYIPEKLSRYVKCINELQFKNRDVCFICQENTAIVECGNKKCVHATCSKCYVEANCLTGKCCYCREFINGEYNILGWVIKSLRSRRKNRVRRCKQLKAKKNKAC